MHNNGGVFGIFAPKKVGRKYRYKCRLKLHSTYKYIVKVQVKAPFSEYTSLFFPSFAPMQVWPASKDADSLMSWSEFI